MGGERFDPQLHERALAQAHQEHRERARQTIASRMWWTAQARGQHDNQVGAQELLRARDRLLQESILR